MKKYFVIALLLLWVLFPAFSSDTDTVDKKIFTRWLSEPFTPSPVVSTNDLSYSLNENPAYLSESRLRISFPSVNVSMHYFSSFITKNKDSLSKILPGFDNATLGNLLSLAWKEVSSIHGINPLLNVGLTTGFQIGNFALGADIKANIDFKNYENIESAVSAVPSIDSVVSAGYGLTVIEDEYISFDIGIGAHLNYRLISDEIPVSDQKKFSIYNIYLKYKDNATVSDIFKYIKENLIVYDSLSVTSDIGLTFGLFEDTVSFNLVFNDINCYSRDVKKYQTLSVLLSGTEGSDCDIDCVDYFRTSFDFCIRPFAKACSERIFDLRADIGIPDLEEFVGICNTEDSTISLKNFNFGFQIRLFNTLEIRLQKNESYNAFGATLDFGGNRIDLSYDWRFESYGLVVDKCDKVSDDTFTIKVTLGYENI